MPAMYWFLCAAVAYLAFKQPEPVAATPPPTGTRTLARSPGTGCHDGTRYTDTVMHVTWVCNDEMWEEQP